MRSGVVAVETSVAVVVAGAAALATGAVVVAGAAGAAALATGAVVVAGAATLATGAVVAEFLVVGAVVVLVFLEGIVLCNRVSYLNPF